MILNLRVTLLVFNSKLCLLAVKAAWGRVGLRVCGLTVGHHGAGAARADSNVEVFNNAGVLTGLFIRVKLK